MDTASFARFLTKSAFRLFAAALVIGAGGAAVAQAPAAGQAQGYPSRPIRLVVPYTAGGGTDLIARAMAQKLTDSLGQTVVVENRAGANGNPGMEYVARSAPDGYTIVYALFAQFAVNPHLYPKLPYDAIKDFAPITLLVRSPYVLVVHPAVPAKSVKELITLAKTRGVQLAYSSAGFGSGAHLAGEMLKSMAHIGLVHVPYKGAAPATLDVMTGQVPFTFATWGGQAGQHTKAGRLRALAVTTAQRASVLPNLPAISETLPGYDLSVWYGMAAPAGTPREIVRKLNSEMVRVLATPDFRQRLEVDANEPIGSTPDQFASYIKSEFVKWGKVVKESGMKID